MKPISQAYKDSIIAMVQNIQHGTKVSIENVWQPANLENRRYVNLMIKDLLAPESKLVGMEHMKELYSLAKQGKSCLLLPEHYSNFDLPVLYYFLETAGEEEHEIAQSIISLAGMKLNEEDLAVSAFTESYPRIVIYPSRQLAKYEGTDQYNDEVAKSRALNRASIHELIRRKHAGHLVLIFPSGTRYRPGYPETKRGVSEMDSYIKTFDYAVKIGIAGNILRLSPDETMIEDHVCEDKVVHYVSPVFKPKEWRNSIRQQLSEGVEPKQFVADKIMEELDVLHQKAEEIRSAG